MKRDFLTSLLPEAEKEIIDKIMAENGADVEKAKGDFTKVKADLEKAKGTLAEYEGQINDLKDKAGNQTDLENKITELQQQIADRAEADKKAAADAQISSRFKAVLGENKFVNDFTASGIQAEFKAALDDEKNAGKSDADIYDEIVKDREGLFANPNPITGTPGVKSVNTDESDMAKARAIMGLPTK